MAYQVLLGDCLESLRGLRSDSVHCCVTSPPYWGLRDYGKPGQIGMEKTPEEYVAKMVEVFREVRRVLRPDGTLWLNLGDSYSSAGGSRPNGSSDKATGRAEPPIIGIRRPARKPKDLIGIPWLVAFALQADGWWLRQDLIWHKPNPMPESVRDRCTKAHEYIFLLSKSDGYYFDAEAIKEEAVCGANGSQFHTGKTGQHQLGRASSKPRSSGNKSHKHVTEYKRGDERHRSKAGLIAISDRVYEMRNRRSVWTVSTKPFKGAHFATMPPDLVEPCVLAGTSKAGCCEGCGAPLCRQTNRTKLRRARPNALTKRIGEAGTGNHCANDVAGVKVETTGWLPACDCEAGVKPCVVLDPFAGSGTTLGVAEANGRDSIGLELNEDYVGLIAGRVAAIVAAKPRPKVRKLPLFEGLSDE